MNRPCCDCHTREAHGASPRCNPCAYEHYRTMKIKRRAEKLGPDYRPKQITPAQAERFAYPKTNGVT